MSACHSSAADRTLLDATLRARGLSRSSTFQSLVMEQCAWLKPLASSSIEFRSTASPRRPGALGQLWGNYRRAPPQLPYIRARSRRALDDRHRTPQASPIVKIVQRLFEVRHTRGVCGYQPPRPMDGLLSRYYVCCADAKSPEGGTPKRILLTSRCPQQCGKRLVET